MEQEEKKSPVEVIQKLIAIHTTRKEVSERILQNDAMSALHDKQKTAAEQSDRFVKALLNELSQFGDAVQSEVNRDDEYHDIWNKSIADIKTMTPDTYSATFAQSENSLINIYTSTLNAYPDLPDTLQELLNRQVNELKQPKS